MLEQLRRARKCRLFLLNGRSERFAAPLLTLLGRRLVAQQQSSQPLRTIQPAPQIVVFAARTIEESTNVHLRHAHESTCRTSG